MNELRKPPAPAKKIKVPTGDGGWKEVEATQHPGQTQNPEKVEAAMAQAKEKDFYIRVGRCTEALNKFLKVYATDHGLTPEEVVGAVYLENCNNRFFYPEDLGGKERFDATVATIWSWFKENVTT